jgi:glycosyltransferase involved in cell wall biosynthesis
LSPIAPQHPISFVVSHIAPRLGIESAMLELRELLTDAGVTSRVIALGGDSNDSAIVPDVVLCGTPLRGPKRINIIRPERARRHIGRSDGAVVLVGLWAAIPYLATMGKHRQRLIVWEHSLNREKMQTNRALRLLAPIARLLYARADQIISVSTPLTRDLIARGHRNVTTIPNVVAEVTGAASQPSPSTTEHFRIVMLGSLTNTKNQELAIRALASIRSPEISVKVVGDGPDRKHLQDLTTELGLADRVEFLGQLPHSASMELLQEAHCLLHCALGETFGYVYFEAAARNVPVIAVRNSITQELMPELIPGEEIENSPRHVAEAIERLRSAGIAPKAFHEAAERRREIFGCDAIASAWLHALGGNR